MTLVLRSDAFDDGGEIPAKYTCEGADVSPGIYWEGVPPETVSLVLIVDDPDAPDPGSPRMVWDHWVLYNLPPAAGGLPEAVGAADLPTGCGQGFNSWGRTGYGGPCPPVGRHRYFHQLYALNTRLPVDLGTPTKDELRLAMDEHIIARAVLVGTYQKTSGGS